MVNASTDLLLSILSATREYPETSVEKLAILCKHPPNLMATQLKSLEDAHLLQYDRIHGNVNVSHRLNIAIEAVNLGADMERVSRLLTWQEFEEISKESLESTGFKTRRHTVFKWLTRRYEIDLLGMKEPIIIVADCKRWRRNQASRLNAAANEQLLRTEAFQRFLPEHLHQFGLQTWRSIQLIPAIIEIATREATLFDGVPIVPVLKLRSFLDQIDPFVPGLMILKVDSSRRIKTLTN